MKLERDKRIVHDNTSGEIIIVDKERLRNLFLGIYNNALNKKTNELGVTIMLAFGIAALTSDFHDIGMISGQTIEAFFWFAATAGLVTVLQNIYQNWGATTPTPDTEIDLLTRKKG